MDQVLALLARNDASQYRLAQTSGLPQSAVSEILRELREPKLGTVLKLLAGCQEIEPGVTFEQLFVRAA